MHVEAMVRSSVVHQIVKGNVSGLSLVACVYNPEKRDSSKSQV